MAEQKLAPVAAGAVTHLSRAAALAQTQRVRIKTPALSGSMVADRRPHRRPVPGQNYRETVEKGSPAVELLRPEAEQDPWFAEIGWVGAERTCRHCPRDTVWTGRGLERSRPGTPVTLTLRQRGGLTFRRACGRRQVHVHGHRHSGQHRPRGGDAGAVRLGAAAGPAGGRSARTTSSTRAASAVRRRCASEIRQVGRTRTRTSTSTGGWVGVTDKYWVASPDPAAARSGEPAVHRHDRRRRPSRLAGR